MTTKQRMNALSIAQIRQLQNICIHLNSLVFFLNEDGNFSPNIIQPCVVYQQYCVLNISRMKKIKFFVTFYKSIYI